MAGSAKSNARILAGECFCRAVGYAVADEFGYALNCHCSNCRRTTGAAFKPFAGIARDKFSVTKGEDDLMIFHAGTARSSSSHAIVTAGGRVLGITGIGEDLVAARTRAYAGVKGIQFEGMQYRNDIGSRAFA